MEILLKILLNSFDLQVLVIKPTTIALILDFCKAIGALATFGAFVLLFKKDNEKTKAVKNLSNLANESSLQTKSLNDQLGEMQEQNRQIKKANLSQKENIFEDRFFNMLIQQQKILEQISFKWEDDQGKHNDEGRRVFEKIRSDIIDLYHCFNDGEINNYKSLLLQLNGCTYKEIESISISDSTFIEVGRDVQEIIKKIKDYSVVNPEKEKQQEFVSSEVYKYIFNFYIVNVGHYFRHLYHILKFISNERLRNSEFTYEKCREYSDLIQASMSMPEMFVLFYNALCYPKMKKEILMRLFLENLRIEDLVDKEHVAFYTNKTVDGNNYSITFKSKTQMGE